MKKKLLSWKVKINKKYTYSFYVFLLIVISGLILNQKKVVSAIQQVSGLSIYDNGGWWPIKSATTASNISNTSYGLPAEGLYVYERQGGIWKPVSGGFAIGNFANATRNGLYTISNIMGVAADGTAVYSPVTVSGPGSFLTSSSGMGNALMTMSVQLCRQQGSLTQAQCAGGQGLFANSQLADTGVPFRINNITTNTDTLNTSPYIIEKLIVNTAGSSDSTIKVYTYSGAASLPCTNGTYNFTLPTNTIGLQDIHFMTLANGFCFTTTGTTPANITITSR